MINKARRAGIRRSDGAAGPATGFPGPARFVLLSFTGMTTPTQGIKVDPLRVLAIVPGFLGSVLGGLLLGLALADLPGNGPFEGPPRWMWACFLPCPVLLLYGLGKLKEPLYLLVFISPPVLFAAGLYLAMANAPKAFAGTVLLMTLAVPVFSNLLISAYYRIRKPRNAIPAR